jgi:hypothetical protein
MKTPRTMSAIRPLSRLGLLAGLLVAAPGCGLPDGEIHVDLLGTWVNSTPNVVNTLEYKFDSTFRASATTIAATSGAQAGCVGRRVTTGRYSVDTENRSLTESGTLVTVSLTGCANAALNMPERALPAADVSYNTTFTYALDRDTLTLRTLKGAAITYTRQ